jgi:hypothetical protein
MRRIAESNTGAAAASGFLVADFTIPSPSARDP